MVLLFRTLRLPSGRRDLPNVAEKLCQEIACHPLLPERVNSLTSLKLETLLNSIEGGKFLVFPSFTIFRITLHFGKIPV